MNKVFESFMAPQLRQFSAYRKQLGYKPDGIRSVLLDFDRYLQKHAVDQSQLTPAFFLKLRAGIHEDPNTVNRVLSGLRALFAFLVRQGLYSQNLLDDIPARGQRYFVPFVFTILQTDQLLQAVAMGKADSADVAMPWESGTYPLWNWGEIPGIVAEDPVTGSAHCTLTPFWAERLGKRTLRARQISLRCGDLLCEERGARVFISGSAVMYLQGEIDVPLL